MDESKGRLLRQLGRGEFLLRLEETPAWRTKLATREQAISEIFEFIEVFYNRQRMHLFLGYTTPVEFETAAKAA